MGHISVSDVGQPSSTSWFRKPPRLWSVLTMAVIAVLLCHELSYPPVIGPRSIVPYLLVAVGLLLLVGYMVRLCEALRRRTFDARQWRWYAAVILPAFALWTWHAGWPLRLRFELSRSSLHTAAVGLLQAGERCTPLSAQNGQLAFAPWAHRLGSYRITEICVIPEQRAVYFVTGGYSRSRSGFVYNPDGHTLDLNLERRPCDDWVQTQPLTPHWLTFTWATS